MNLSRLRTLVAIQDAGGFTAAAGRVNLSQSAVSVQMKQLEHELGGPLFIPGRRPATLTPLGLEAAERARDILAGIDGLRGLNAGDDTGGQIAIGFVPTTLQTLLPRVLRHLQARFPTLGVSVRSGLSAELGKAIETQTLDFAFLTSPLELSPRIGLTEIAKEPLFVIDDGSGARPRSDLDILRARPYIAFSRKTWLGRRIDAVLARRGLTARPPIELDSVDAVEHLVAEGLGVSVVPQRLGAPPLAERLRCTPFLDEGRPVVRRLMLAAQGDSRRETLKREIVAALAPGR